MKPERRWCLCDAKTGRLHTHLMSDGADTFVEFLRRACEQYGGPLASVGLGVVEVEVRVAAKKKAKKRGGRNGGR